MRYRLSPGKRFYPDYFGSQRGFSGYPELVKSYLSDGLRRDKAICLFGPATRLVDALKKRGVPEDVLQDAARDILLTQQD